jgi:glycosyltransferase involved in cell wall biosynthesis
MRDMNPRPSEPDAFGINLYGYLTACLGLGVAARNTAEMLLANGVATRLVDVNPGGGMQGRDSTFAEQIAASRGVAPYGVNLFHFNPDQVPYLLSPFDDRVALDGRLNACVPFWELPRIPDSWLEPLSGMQLVLAPTRFIETAIREALPTANVVHYPQAVHLPAGIESDRDRFGLSRTACIFVMSFDMRSDIERKNPWAVIEAFGRAFGSDDDVALVIKANNAETIAGLSKHVDRLRATSADPRIVVLDQPLAYADVLALYASCDALVSLHRAEGLGLSLLEAMSLGKPVVATAWSGNMDFMTLENSCPVAYKLVDVVASTQPAYGRGIAGAQQWAEPDVDDAAEWMRRLADDEMLRRRIGQRAEMDAEAIRQRYDRGEMVGTLRSAWEKNLAAPDSNAVLKRMRTMFPYNYSRRVVRAVLHRVKTRLRG